MFASIIRFVLNKLKKWVSRDERFFNFPKANRMIFVHHRYPIYTTFTTHHGMIIRHEQKCHSSFTEYLEVTYRQFKSLRLFAYSKALTRVLGKVMFLRLKRLIYWYPIRRFTSRDVSPHPYYCSAYGWCSFTWLRVVTYYDQSSAGIAHAGANLCGSFKIASFVSVLANNN